MALSKKSQSASRLLSKKRKVVKRVKSQKSKSLKKARKGGYDHRDDFEAGQAAYDAKLANSNRENASEIRRIQERRKVAKETLEPKLNKDVTKHISKYVV